MPGPISGGASASSLAATLAVGNTTGAADIIASSGRKLVGAPGAGADNAGGVLVLAGGVSTGAADPGAVVVRASFPIGTGSTPQTLGDRLYIGKPMALSLTSSTTQTFATLSTANNGCYMGRVTCFLEATDGTNYSTYCGYFLFAGVNKAGTVTVQSATSTGGGNLSSPATQCNTGTLQAMPQLAVSGTNIQLQIVPSWSTLTPTSVRMSYVIELGGEPSTVTPS